jgi:hypothetical protein
MSAYTRITGKRSVMDTTLILSGYSRPSWREFNGIKTYTLLDGTQAFQAGEYTVLVLAINAKGDIDPTHTIVKKGNETPRSVASTGIESTIIKAIQNPE